MTMVLTVKAIQSEVEEVFRELWVRCPTCSQYVRMNDRQQYKSHPIRPGQWCKSSSKGAVFNPDYRAAVDTIVGAIRDVARQFGEEKSSADVTVS
jgi:hypothetical protein